MPRFEVTIVETITSTEVPAPADFVPEPRGVHWVGEASDQDAAKELAYAAWDDKYGPGKQPVQAITRITPLDG